MTNTKRICHYCVGEPFFRADVARNGPVSGCTYCGKRTHTFSIGQIADRVELAFKQHYQRTSTDADTYERRALADRESDYVWHRHGDRVTEAIADAAEIPEEAASEIQKELEDRHYDHDSAPIGEETEFDSESHYEERDLNGDYWRRQWFELDRTIKTQARFFGHNANQLLTSIFSDLEQLSASSLNPLIIDIGPDLPRHTLYRARVFQSDEPLKAALCRPDLQLGPPPSNIALAGRMNARGISVFYGATDPEVAIPEVRPPVGARVLVGRFEIIRPLRILSLGFLSFARADGSIFDNNFADLCHKVAFLQSLSDILCRPVVPSDEDLEYLATQAIADFLATERDPALDGIAYPSTHTDGSGQNVVLFHKAARVETLDLPEGTQIEASTGYNDEDGWYTDYSVWETLYRTSDSTTNPSQARLQYPRSQDPTWWDYWDHRKPSLRIDVGSLEVHEVEGVKVSTQAYPVSRSRTHEPAKPTF